MLVGTGLRIRLRVPHLWYRRCHRGTEGWDVVGYFSLGKNWAKTCFHFLCALDLYLSSLIKCYGHTYQLPYQSSSLRRLWDRCPGPRCLALLSTLQRGPACSGRSWDLPTSPGICWTLFLSLYPILGFSPIVLNTLTGKKGLRAPLRWVQGFNESQPSRVGYLCLNFYFSHIN